MKDFRFMGEQEDPGLEVELSRGIVKVYDGTDPAPQPLRERTDEELVQGISGWYLRRGGACPGPWCDACDAAVEKVLPGWVMCRCRGRSRFLYPEGTVPESMPGYGELVKLMKERGI